MINFNKIIGLIFLTSLFLSCAKTSEVRLASLFQNHMVLQQKSSVTFWGWAEPNSDVSIYTSWNQEVKHAKTDKEGRFETTVKTLKAGGPYEVTIRSKNEIKLHNVMLGEVWVCSGQSNMEMPLKGFGLKDSIKNSAQEILGAKYPNIRLFNIPREIALAPQTDVKGVWKVCNTENAGDFSAVAFFFAKKLYQELNVPIGLIQTTWGGTPVESWMPIEDVKKIERFKGVFKDVAKEQQVVANYSNWIESMAAFNFLNFSYQQMSDKLDTIAYMFKEFDEDDKNWDTHKLPKSFETQFEQIDAVVWYRREFVFNEDPHKEGYELFLGAIDDFDTTYLNGVKIGGEEGWQVDRIYTIPEGLLKKGKNSIAVRVLDNAGGGGIYRDTPQIRRKDKKVVGLGGMWKYKMVGCFENPTTFRLFDTINNFRNRPKLLFHYQSPTVLYNAMVAPLIPYTIKGAIWYQGENNVWNPKEYAISFPLMIKAWRTLWKQQEFPFYYVQIAPYRYDTKGPNSEEKAAILREAQRLTMKLPNTGMVVTSDIGNLNNIHPENKQDVGERLAFWALNKNYKKEKLVYSGPLYKGIKVNGNSIIVSFKNIGGGLYCPDKTLTYFEIAGEDGAYYPAKGIIKKNQVVVSSLEVKQPIHIRFGWKNDAVPNLFNKEGLPAASFTSKSIMDK
jgi:sialate O-acetylesterase